MESINLQRLKELAESHEPLSYKKLCDELSLKYYSGGCSKNRQLDELNTICQYHIEQKPTRYVIDEYYEAFAPSIINGRNKFVPYIEAILCSLLKTEEKVYLTNSEILLMCKIVNSNFTTARVKSNQRKICHQLGYDLIDFSTFVGQTYNRILAPVVRSALTSLERRSVISIAKTYKIRKEVEEGTVIVTPVPYQDPMQGELQQIEHEMKEAYNIKGDYIYPEVAEAYYEACNKLAKKRLGIEGFFACKEIKTTKKIIAKELPKLIKALNESVAQKVFDSKHLDSLTNEFKRIMTTDMLSLNPPVHYNDCVRKENELERIYIENLMKAITIVRKGE